MNKTFLFLIYCLFLYFILTSCANVTAPSGGPRDTLAPVRILTIPMDKSINYKGKTIVLEFDERIKTEKIKEQLILTPFTESDYEVTIKKNNIKLSYEEPFQDSTTYTLNFRESIQDITEGNPTKDNKFTFSTGNYIDSMSITGYVKDLLTFDTLENIVVGLYRPSDTITIYDGSPYYFTELQEDGSYLIENIKNDEYLLYAFQDENKNLKLETNNEKYGFSKDTILLDSGLYRKNIDLVKLDISKFRVMTAISSGKYFDINFNKYIVDYDIISFDSAHQVYTNRAKENKSIRFYNNFDHIDSLQIAFTARDSLNEVTSDTLFVKFVESRRKKDDFNMTVFPEKNASIEPETYFKIQFNKPVIEVNTDSIFIQYDTTMINQVHDSLLAWNKFRDELSISLVIDRAKADTILNRSIKLKSIQKDSLIKAQTNRPQIKQQIKKDQSEEGPKINKGLQLYFGTGAFQSADQDTSKAFGYNYKFLIPTEKGTQEVKIQTQYQGYIVQLTDTKFNVIKEISNEQSIVFKNIDPGNYKIRVLIDANNDGVWSPGNM